jgi:hypothetical protein
MKQRQMWKVFSRLVLNSDSFEENRCCGFSSIACFLTAPFLTLNLCIELLRKSQRSRKRKRCSMACLTNWSDRRLIGDEPYALMTESGSEPEAHQLSVA